MVVEQIVVKLSRT